MLVYNTMRFGTDVLTAADSTGGLGVRKAMLMSAFAFDFTDVTDVIRLVINGSEQDGTTRRFMFKIDDEIYRFVNGTLTAYTKEATLDNVLADGNTAAELSALSHITAFVGKNVHPIFALASTGTYNPSVNMGYACTISDFQLTKNANTATYPLPVADDSGTPVITSIIPDVTTQGRGAVTILVRLKSAAGVWGDWMTLAQAVGNEATRVQFQFQCSVEAFGGVDSAKVNSIQVNYITAQENVTGSTAEMYSIIPHFETDLRLCYLVVRHKQLIDSSIDAFVNFMPAYKSRERISIGTGIGEAKQYTLGVDDTADAQIDPSSIRIFVDGILTGDFDYDTATSKVTVNATSGFSILASYNYDCGQENWRAMTPEAQQPYGDGTYMTRFTYALPDGEDAQRANIRLRLNRPAGTVTNVSLGKATGKTQQIVLPHLATTSSIVLNADWSYDFDSRILTLVAGEHTDLTLSYDYVGEQHQIYSWAAGWSAD